MHYLRDIIHLSFNSQAGVILEVAENALVNVFLPVYSALWSYCGKLR